MTIDFAAGMANSKTLGESPFDSDPNEGISHPSSSVASIENGVVSLR